MAGQLTSQIDKATDFMSDSNENLATEKKLLAEVNQKPLLSRWGTFAKLSGPGWLQGAITLGGGSLAGSLYLGVIGGYELLLSLIHI